MKFEELKEIMKEFDRGKKAGLNLAINIINKRKYVWNEEKFGSKKNHKLFDEFVFELQKELKAKLKDAKSQEELGDGK